MIRLFGKHKIFVAVISGRRPKALKPMTDVVGRATWFVDVESEPLYSAELKTHDLDSEVRLGGPLCCARNMALDAASLAGLPCLQLSDDLKKIEEPVWSILKGKYVAGPLHFDDAVARMAKALRETGARLGGVAPTANPFYYRGKPIHTKAFVVGDMMLIDPSSPHRFDEAMHLKEDYDLTVQHLTSYGLVARCDDVLATFQHRSNAGGAVSYRTPAGEQKAIDYLKKKWPGVIIDNPKRKDEILLRLK